MKLEAKHHAMVVLATTAVNGTRPRGSTTSSRHNGPFDYIKIRPKSSEEWGFS